MKSNLNLIILSMCFLISSVLQAQQYDLLIVNGHLIDAKNNIDQRMDIAIKEGKITAVEKKINPDEGKKVIDAEGLIVSPGLIDMHTHNFHGTQQSRYLANSFTALPPDGFTFRSGVTTVVDAGSPGWRNIEIYKNQTIEPVSYTHLRAHET